MAEKLKVCEISLSPSKAHSSVVCTLKIPNFFILPEYDCAFVLDSTNFEFANATWCIRFENEDKEKKLGHCINFHSSMIRLKYEKPKQMIFYKITILDVENKEYAYEGDTLRFAEDCQEKYMWRFDNTKPNYDRRDSLTIIVHLFHVKSIDMDAADQVSVATDKDVLSLSQDFKDILLNGQDHNLTFNVKDKKFRAHQDIMRARSEVFRSMLSHDMLEKNSGVIEVPDCDPEAFEQLLCYIYTGKVEIMGENNMFSLYYAADKYNLVPLKDMCCEFIKGSLTVNNVSRALELASKHSDPSLLESASSYLFNNLDDTLLTVEWQLFMKENSTVANELFIKSVKFLRDTKT